MALGSSAFDPTAAPIRVKYPVQPVGVAQRVTLATGMPWTAVLPFEGSEREHTISSQVFVWAASKL